MRIVPPRNFIIVFAVILTAGVPKSLHAYETRHVFIVIIDGLRNDEAFDDSSHQFIPRIWNGLRPLGTIYTELYSTTMTYTMSGHTTIVTGTRNNFPNADTVICEPYRPRAPTIFEYYRKAHGAPKRQAWVIAGKPYLHSLDHSLHPEYGLPYAATKLFNVGDDTTTLGTLYDVMDDVNPSLVLLNLRDVDVKGHTGHWEKYTEAITIADSLVWDLWEHIQDDPGYAGHTTMFLTTDHGRHDNLHGGFQHHGGTDHGSEHILFLAVGPDIIMDAVFDERRDLTDIAPTVGELLGFATPYANGTVMSEMIIPPGTRGAGETELPEPTGGDRLVDRITTTPAMSTCPVLALSTETIHLTWTEGDPAFPSRKSRVTYAQKNMNSDTWSEATTLFPDIDNTTVFAEGRIFAHGAGEIAAVSRSLFRIYNIMGKATYQWFPTFSTSPDGYLWSETTIFNDFAGGSREPIPSVPAAVGDSLEIFIGWITANRSFTLERSTDGGAGFARLMDTDFNEILAEFYTTNVALAKFDPALLVTAEYNLFHANRLPRALFSAGTSDAVSLGFIDQAGRDLSFSPAAAKTSAKLHFVWSELLNGTWNVCYRNCYPDGSWLSEIINISNSAAGALNPCLIARNDSLVIAWEDYRYEIPEIYSALSRDEGLHWYNPTRITYTPGRSICPSIAVWETQLVVAWQDESDGNWEIYYQETPLLRLGRPGYAGTKPP